MGSRVRINGEWFDKLKAGVGILDHGLLYGDGVTVGIRIEAGKARYGLRHCERLFEAARDLGIKLPGTELELLHDIDETIRASERVSGYVKVLLTRGAGTMGPDPRKCEPTVVLIADDCVPYPYDVAQSGLHVIAAKSATRTPAPEDRGLLMANVLAVRAMREAIAAGCLDAVILDPAGLPTGIIDGELFAVRGGSIFSPTLAASPDPLAALELRDEFRIREAPLTLEDLTTADELFLASTAAGVVPIVQLDGIRIAAGIAGTVTEAVRRRHRELCSV